MAKAKPTQTRDSAPPPTASAAVLKESAPVPRDAQEIHGIDFNDHARQPVTVEAMLASMASTGFQASAIAEAVDIINNDMTAWRDPDDPDARTTIFLGYTSNLVSSGLREVLRWLVEHKHVAAVVTTAGGVEEDLIKCLAPTYLGSFTSQGAELREKGLNRIGNLFVPNDNYCRFEEWVIPILDRMLDEQEEEREKGGHRNREAGHDSRHADFEQPFCWTPSAVIARLGRELDDDRSICTWAARNGIPVYCPALTDGSLGDMLYFHSYKASPRRFTIDITADIRGINDIAIKAKRTGVIILGGGLVKHHIANANLMRNGADSAVYINTAQEFDGSDAGARPDEAVSWGKLKADGRSVKVYAEATVVFPMIVAGTFARVEGQNGVAEEENVPTREGNAPSVRGERGVVGQSKQGLPSREEEEPSQHEQKDMPMQDEKVSHVNEEKGVAADEDDNKPPRGQEDPPIPSKESMPRQEKSRALDAEADGGDEDDDMSSRGGNASPPSVKRTVPEQEKSRDLDSEANGPREVDNDRNASEERQKQADINEHHLEGVEVPELGNKGLQDEEQTSRQAYNGDGDESPQRSHNRRRPRTNRDHNDNGRNGREYDSEGPQSGHDDNHSGARKVAEGAAGALVGGIAEKVFGKDDNSQSKNKAKSIAGNLAGGLADKVTGKNNRSQGQDERQHSLRDNPGEDGYNEARNEEDRSRRTRDNDREAEQDRDDYDQDTGRGNTRRRPRRRDQEAEQRDLGDEDEPRRSRRGIRRSREGPNDDEELPGRDRDEVETRQANRRDAPEDEREADVEEGGPREAEDDRDERRRNRRSGHRSREERDDDDRQPEENGQEDKRSSRRDMPEDRGEADVDADEPNTAKDEGENRDEDRPRRRRTDRRQPRREPDEEDQTSERGNNQRRRQRRRGDVDNPDEEGTAEDREQRADADDPARRRRARRSRPAKGEDEDEQARDGEDENDNRRDRPRDRRQHRRHHDHANLSKEELEEQFRREIDSDRKMMAMHDAECER